MRHFQIFLVILLAMLQSGAIAWGGCVPSGTETLDVRQVNEDGFGDTTNRYAWAMTEFKGKLYVGTNNLIHPIPGIALFFLGLPFTTNGAQIWRGDIDDEGTWSWEKVVDRGNTSPLNYGIRKMTAVKDYLYAVTGNHICGFEVWRTLNGTNWEVVAQQGFGNAKNTSGRGLAVFKGYLYVGTENRTDGAQIWRRRLNHTGDFARSSEWEKVVDRGLGDPLNFWFSDFEVYGDYLYTGTLRLGGMQLWRTDGKDFEQIFDKGYDDPTNMGAMKLYLYDDKLYIGTMNWLNGFDLYVSAETLDHYEGEHPAIVFNKVLEDDRVGGWSPYIWYLQGYKGRLYAGSFRLLGAFKLFSSADGETFELETDDSFGCPAQYGVRTMEVFKGRLMIGTATALPDESCKVLEVTPAP